VTGDAFTAQVVDGIVAGFAELDPRPEADPALRRPVDSGIRVIALTDGSERNTGTLLYRAGLERHAPTALSVDGVRTWKPAPEVCRYAAAKCGMRPGDLALVAAHSWDTHGARRAGLAARWVSYLQRRYRPIFDPPDVSGDTLSQVVDGLLAGT
jgi:2-haloacid dehalogenase